jgi:hypothetical protein
LSLKVKPRRRSREKKTPKPKLRPGEKVILEGLPPGFTIGLPEEDQRAISARVGRPILFIKYDRHGRAELEFMDNDDGIHTLYVDRKYIRVW